MKLPTFKTQDEVPEAFRSLYEEKSGEWVPKGEPGEGAHKALQDERKRADDAEKAAKEARDARTQMEARITELEQEIQAKAAGKTGDELKELRNKIRQDVEREHSQKVKALEERVQALEPLEGENRDLKLYSKVRKSMADNGVRPERIEALLRLERDEFDLTDDGEPMLKNHPGKAVDIFVQDDLKKQYPEFYQGTKADGGGAGGGHAGVLDHGVTADDVRANPTAARAAARAKAS